MVSFLQTFTKSVFFRIAEIFAESEFRTLILTESTWEKRMEDVKTGSRIRKDFI
jgi:hypothetical protein